MNRIRMTALFVGVLTLASLDRSEAGDIRAVAEITPDRGFPVATFMVVRTQLLADGRELVNSWSSSFGPVSEYGGPPAYIVDTLIPDVPPSAYHRQFAFFVGAYGGTYANEDDPFQRPLVRPDSPHTGMITSLPTSPNPTETFESIWGVDEATILLAYQDFVYDFPDFNSTPEENAAWHIAVAPFLDMISANLDLLLPWIPGSNGNFDMSGRLVQFSDPVDIGGIQGNFQSTFAVVPEPSSLALACIGTFTFCLIRLRRSRVS